MAKKKSKRSRTPGKTPPEKRGAQQTATAKKRARQNRPTTEGKKKAFLISFRETGNVKLSAQEAGVDRATVYRWKDSDDEFAQAMSKAHDDAVDLLIQEARRRALQGVEEPVFQKGEEVGRIRKYSDVLLIFLIKGGRPEVYRERYELKHAGSIQTGDSALAAAVASDPEARSLATDLLRRVRDTESGPPSD